MCWPLLLHALPPMRAWLARMRVMSFQVLFDASLSYNVKTLD
jgi:hypothetical protein